MTRATLNITPHARPASTPRSLRAVTWLIAAVIVATCCMAALAALSVEAPEEAFTLAAIAATLTLAAMFVAEYRASGNALHPMCIASVMLFLLYPFHGIMTHDNPTLTELVGTDAAVWQTKALLIVTVSVPFLRLGFHSRVAAAVAALFPRPRFDIDDDHPTTTSKLVILYIVSILPRAAAIAFGQNFHWDNPDRSGEEIQFLLTILVNVPVFVTAWFLVQGMRNRTKRTVLIGLAMLGGELAWGLASGSRVRMLLPIVAAVAAISYLYRPMKLRTLVIVCAIFVLVVFPFATAFRTAYFGRMDEVQRDGIGASTVVDAISEAATADDEGLFGATDGPLDALAERLHGLTSLSLIIRYTPERADYGFGVPYLLILPQIIIPRLIWNDKPDMAPFAAVFREQYWGVDPSSSTSVAVSQLGDLYANLHIFGTTLGCFAYGIFLALTFGYLRFGVRSRSIFPVVVFSVHLTGFMHALESPFDAAIAGFAKSLFVYFVIAWLLSRRAPPVAMKA